MQGSFVALRDTRFWTEEELVASRGGSDFFFDIETPGLRF
jgi:hypothetical protein